MIQGRDVDLLLGLDMLKAHQACIDLERNVLRIQSREVRFLPEHELPDQARIMETSQVTAEPLPSAPSAPSVASGSGGLPRNPPSFPSGGGHTLGAVPNTRPLTAGRPTVQQAPASRYPEGDIRFLMDLGATREMATGALEAANGNLDVAASLLF